MKVRQALSDDSAVRVPGLRKWCRRWRSAWIRSGPRALRTTLFLALLGLVSLAQVRAQEADLAVQVTTAVVDANGDAVGVVSESVGDLTVTVTAATNGTQKPEEAVTFRVVALDGTAFLDEDFLSLDESPTLSATEWVLADGIYTAEREYALSIVDDDYYEPGRETVEVVTTSLAATPSYVTLGQSAGITIVDDDRLAGPPTSLEATAAGTTAIDLGWTAPSDLGTSPVMGYQLEWSANGQAGWRFLAEDTESSATTFTDTGLQAQTTRHYRVTALTAAGIGGTSEPASATTEEEDDLAVQVTTTVVDANGDAVGEVSEGIGALTVRVTAATNGMQKPDEPVTFEVVAQNGTAILNEDFLSLDESPTLSVAEWMLADGIYTAEREYVLSIVDDDSAEPERETVEVVTSAVAAVELVLPSLAATPSYVTLPASVNITIVDDDRLAGPPTSLEATAEGATAIDLNWTAPSDPGTSPVSGYQLEWSADGQAGWRFLAADTKSSATTFTDTGLQAQTTRHYRVSALTAAGIGQASEPVSATTAEEAPEEDDLAVQLTTTVVDANGDAVGEVSEGIGALTVRVTAATNGMQKPDEAITFEVVAQNGTAILNEDFLSLDESPTLSVAEWMLADGIYTAEREYVLSIVDDDSAEPERETVEVVTSAVAAVELVLPSLAATPAYVTLPASVNITIVDDDRLAGPPTSLEATAAGATAIGLNWTAPSDPGTSPVSGYQLEWSADGQAGWTLLLVDTESTATTFTDTGLQAQTTRHYRVSALTAAGIGQASEPVSATTAEEAPEEADLAVQLTTRVVDANGDAVGEVSESIGDLTVTLTAATNGMQKPDEAVTFQVVAHSDTAILDEDFLSFEESPTLSVAEWVLADGIYTAEREYVLSIVDDDSAEEERETVEVVTSSHSDTPDYVTLAAPVDVVIVDDDTVPGPPTEGGLAVRLTTAVVDANGDAVGEVSESIGDLTVTVTAETNGTQKPDEAVTFQVVAHSDTAILGEDFLSLDESPTLSVAEWVLADGIYTAEREYVLSIVDDDSAEPERETVEVVTSSLSDTPDYVTLAAPVGVVIVDDDTDSVEPTNPELPEVAFTEWTSEVAEGETATFTLVRSGSLAAALKVTVELTETGSTIRGTAPTSAVFAAGAERTTLTVQTIDDSVDEPDSVISVTLTAGQDAAYVVGSEALATVTVKDDDGESTAVTITAAEGSVPEGADVTFVLNRTGPAGEQLTVLLDVAAPDLMLRGTPPDSVSFAAGAGEATLVLPTIDDPMDGPDRDVVATLLNGDGYTLDRVASATVRVRDNDEAAVLSIADASAPESGGSLTFQVTLQGRSAMPVEVAWSTSPGSATADLDYTAVSGVLTLDPGSAGGEIVIPLSDDLLFEENETFRVSLSRPKNAKLAGDASSATGVIEDDDAAPVFRVDDSSAPESGFEMAFTVSLSGESALPVTVRWTSVAETAQPGLDYLETRGELFFAPGATSQRIVVPVLDDLLVEEAETFRVYLSEASHAAFETGSVASATGTIQDDDDSAPAKAWLARFGRTAASSAVDAVEDRLMGRLGAGDQVVLAGYRVDVVGGEQDDGAAGSDAAPVGGLVGSGQAAGVPGGSAGFGGGLRGARAGRHGSGPVQLGDLIARSSFRFSSDSNASGTSNRETANDAVHTGDVGGPGWSVWGSGASTRFGGGEDALSLDGEVVSGTVGADIERGRVLFGVAVSHSRGDGDYRRNVAGGLRAREGDLSSDLTTGLPYLRIAVNDRLSVWGALGRGSGSMTLSEGELGSVEADIGMTLGAFGARRELRSSADTDGFRLALRTDLLLVQTTSDESEALPALSADVDRLRLMVEGVRQWQFDSGVVLTPKVELGLRYDDGDAETGGGLEVGAGLRLENAARGLSAQLTGHSLMTHEASELSEWGVGASFRFEPGGSDRGLSIGLRSTLGAASSGIARLWEQQSAAPSGYPAVAPGSVTEAEVGYGWSVLGSRGSLTPYFGAGLSDRSGGAYRAGARLRVGEFFALDAEAARAERKGAMPSFSAALLANLRW